MSLEHFREPTTPESRMHRAVLLLGLGLDGHVESARVTRSIPLLQEAALDAVRQWQFAPISVAAGRVIVQNQLDLWTGAGWQRLYWVEPLSARDSPRAGVSVGPAGGSRLSGVAEQLRQVVGREPSIRALPRDLRQCLD